MLWVPPVAWLRMVHGCRVGACAAAPGGDEELVAVLQKLREAALDFFGQFREGRVSKSEVLQTGSSALRPSDDWIPVSPRFRPSIRNPQSQNLYHKPSRVLRETHIADRTPRRDASAPLTAGATAPRNPLPPAPSSGVTAGRAPEAAADRRGGARGAALGPPRSPRQERGSRSRRGAAPSRLRMHGWMG